MHHSAVGRLGAQQRYTVWRNNDGVPFGSMTTVYLFGSAIAGTETLQATRQRGPSCFWCRRKIRSLRSPVVPLFCEHGPLRLAVARGTLLFWPNKGFSVSLTTPERRRCIPVAECVWSAFRIRYPTIHRTSPRST